MKQSCEEKKYEAKLRREKEWYRHDTVQKGHWLNSRLFYSPKRHAASANFCRMQFVRRIQEVLEQHHLTDPRMLIAPTGSGYDLPYLLPLSRRIVGIDISAVALESIRDNSIEKHVGDIKHMDMFQEGEFDIVVMSQFFHHFLDFGFDEFVLEARRVLQSGGHFFSFEPSILHPFAAAAWCGKRIFGNVSGCVEDESPFCPQRLANALTRCGFVDVGFSATSYSHLCMPVPLARIINTVTRPLLRAPLLKHFAYYCVFYGRKSPS